MVPRMKTPDFSLLHDDVLTAIAVAQDALAEAFGAAEDAETPEALAAAAQNVGGIGHELMGAVAHVR